MTLIEKLDRVVYMTRLDRLVLSQARPRNLRWTPFLVVGALIAGYALMAKATPVTDPDFWIGWLLFYGAFVAACFVRVLGPRFTATVHQPLDERELMVKARAHAISGVVLGIAAMLGCFYMASAGLPGFWHPNAPLEWLNLGFGVQAAAMFLPTWIASWLEPSSPASDED